MSYRKLAGMPLIAVVGLAKATFSSRPMRRCKYILAGTVLTLIVLIVMIFGAGSRRTSWRPRRSSAVQAMLEQSNLLLHTALKNMAHGLDV